jgi:hypothetical protein
MTKDELPITIQCRRKNVHHSAFGIRYLMVALLALGVATTHAATNTPPVTVDERTEAVIQGALKYLAAKQAPNGSWSAQSQPIAMTGYTLLAFLATGNLPDEGPHGKTVANGVRFLLEAAQADGMFTPANDGRYMYGHGIATCALAEIYGQTKSETIRPKLEKLVKLIVDSQNVQGGWRYRPTSTDADVSVTVVQVVALRAARNAGLKVPEAAFEKAVQYVRSCRNETSGGFSYQPRQQPGFACTAAAVYSLQVCGQYNDPLVKAGSEYLSQQTVTGNKEWFTYGQFYASPVQYTIGGATWEQWYREVKKVLLEHAERDGELVHWEPVLDVGKRMVPGTLYCTAVYTTILAIPYNYIPLYQR